MRRWRLPGTRFVAQGPRSGALRLARNCGLRGRDFPPSRRTDRCHARGKKPCSAGLEPTSQACDGRQKEAWVTAFSRRGAHKTMLVFRRLTALLAAGAAGLAGAALAAPGDGEPHPWQLGLQPSASPVMDDIVWFH